MTLTFVSFDGLPSRLYSRNWYAPSTIPSATACAASAAARSGATLASVVATDAALRGAACDRGPGAAQAVERELVELADADEHRRLGLELPGGGHRERLAQLGLEAGLVEERGEPTAERGVDDVGARPEGAPVPVFAIGTASRSAATRSAGVVTTENVSDTGFLR